MDQILSHWNRMNCGNLPVWPSLKLNLGDLTKRQGQFSVWIQTIMRDCRAGRWRTFPDMRFLDYCSHVSSYPCLPIGLLLAVMNALHLNGFCGETNFIRSAQNEQPRQGSLLPKGRCAPEIAHIPGWRSGGSGVCAGCCLTKPFMALLDPSVLNGQLNTIPS